MTDKFAGPSSSGSASGTFKPGSTQFPGFTTGNGKPVKLSAAAIARANSIFKDEKLNLTSFHGVNNIDLAEQKTPNQLQLPPVVGFTTGNGKPVKLSAAAIARANTIFKDEKLNLTSFQGVNNIDLAEQKTPNQLQLPPVVGFTTGNGKPVKLSAAAIARANTIFKDEKLNLISFQGANNIDVAKQKTPNQLQLPPVVGFTTGNGKPVKLSAAAIAHANSIFKDEKLNHTSFQGVNDIDPAVQKTPNQLQLPPVVGFTTGNGKPVKLSAAAIAHANSIFKDEKFTLTSFQGVNDIDLAEQKPPQQIRGRNNRPSSSDDALKKLFCLSDTEEEEVDGEDEREERELSPIIDPRQLEFFRSKESENVRRKLSFTVNDAVASTPVGSSSHPKQKRSRMVPRMFSNIRSIAESISPGPSPKRTKIDEFDMSDTQMASELTADLLADEEKCELLGEDSVLSFTKSVTPTLVSSSVRSCREKGRLIQINAVKHRMTTGKPVEGFLRQFRKLHIDKRIAMGHHEDLIRPKQYSEEELLLCNVKKSVLDINARNAALFRFDGEEFFGTELVLTNADGILQGDGVRLFLASDCGLGVKEVANGFMSSAAVDPALISFEWVLNHYKWIVWTLASYETRFPHQFGGRALTPDNVLFRLKYRYDREIDKSERSAIRRIVEQDDGPGKRMVLFVSDIFDNGNLRSEGSGSGDSQSSDSKPKFVPNLELSDGWYKIDCLCGPEFLSFIEKGIVSIGTKLILQGAELIASEPMHPLEAGGKAMLKFGSNCVRRAKWHCSLGFCDTPCAYPILLNSVIHTGGLVPLLHVTIARVYPIVYHTKEDGKTVFYSQKYFDKMQREKDIEKEKQFDRIYAEVRKEVEDELKAKARISDNSDDSEELGSMSTKKILALIDSAEDPNSIQGMLSKSKLEQVRTAQQKRQEDIRNLIDTKVNERMSSLTNTSDAVPVVKIRVLDAATSAAKVRDIQQSASLSIWRPQEDVLSFLSEGLSFKVFSLMPSHPDSASLKRVAATRSTKFLPLPLRNPEVLDLIQRKCYTISHIIEEDFNPVFNELDTVGLIVYISPILPSGQTVYISDENKNILGIRLWSSITSQGLDDVLALHNFLSASNLSWRASSRSTKIITTFLQESTVFVLHPKQAALKNALEELKTNVGKDVWKFADSCETVVFNLLSSRSPGSSTTTLQTSTPANREQVNLRKSSLMRNVQSPPKLHQIPLHASTRVSRKFQPPRRINIESKP